MRIVAFVPIKLNNQRLPGKNTRPLNGRPLCGYLLETLAGLEEVHEKYVYCSDEAISPYLPSGISLFKRDRSLDGFAVKGLEIIAKFLEDVDADIYVLAHVTQPFTRAESLSRAIEKVVSDGYDSAFSAVRLQDYLWRDGLPLNYDPTDIVRTQDLDPIFMETGAFFVFRREVFTELGRRVGLHPYVCEVDQFEAIDIDTQEDFEFAEAAAEYLYGRSGEGERS